MPLQATPIKEKIGFFGGSFDPIHNGHVEMAREIIGHTSLAYILFCPARQAPLREKPHHATPVHRLAMVAAAVENHDDLEVTDIEIRNEDDFNYTNDTIKQLREQKPTSDISLILGADKLAQLPRWRYVKNLVEENEFIVLARPGYEIAPPVDLPKLRLRTCETNEFDVSSTEIRRLISDGQPFEHLVPNPVASYIQENNLYR